MDKNKVNLPQLKYIRKPIELNIDVEDYRLAHSNSADEEIPMANLFKLDVKHIFKQAKVKTSFK